MTKIIIFMILLILALQVSVSAQSTPTGCPYGDGIPLDSPKCTPKIDKEVEAAKPEPKPATVQEPVKKAEPVQKKESDPCTR